MNRIQINIDQCNEEDIQRLLLLLQENGMKQIMLINDDEKQIVKEHDIIKVLAEFGIPTNLKGYRYMKTAIELCVKDRSIMDSVTKCLYPEIAKRHQVDGGQVEHAIRHAIQKAWKNHNTVLQKRLFGNSLENGVKPTNSAFIATVADYLELAYY